MRTRRFVALAGGLLLLAFGAIQLVPYGRDHTNPAVVSEPRWDSQRTRSLAVKSCFDCHRNETVWPWYSNVAPLSWQLQDHVDEGRRVLNFSDWGAGQEEAGEAAETVAEGSMPPISYRLTHPSSRLSMVERQALIDGLLLTFRIGGKRVRDALFRGLAIAGKD